MQKNPAFTLVEVLIVVLIIGMVAVPLYFSLNSSKGNQSLYASAEQLGDTLKKAHVYSREIKDKRQWGVSYKDESTYALTSRESVDSEVTYKDEKLASGIVFENSFDIWFAKGTGDFQSGSSEIVLQNKQGKRFQVEILQTGIVQINPL